MDKNRQEPTGRKGEEAQEQGKAPKESRQVGKNPDPNFGTQRDQIAEDPEDQTRTWSENEDSSMDTDPEKDRKAGAKWAKKDAHPGKASGKADETKEEESGWNANDFGEGRGFRQPNTLDQQTDHLKGKEKKD